MRFTSRNEPPPRRDAQSEKTKPAAPRGTHASPKPTRTTPHEARGPAGGGARGGKTAARQKPQRKNPPPPQATAKPNQFDKGGGPDPPSARPKTTFARTGGRPTNKKTPPTQQATQLPPRRRARKGRRPKRAGSKRARHADAAAAAPTQRAGTAQRRPQSMDSAARGGQRHIHGESGAEGEPREGTRRTATHQPKGRGGKGDGSRRRALPIDGCTKDRAEPSANGGPRGWARNLQQEYLLIFFSFSNWLGVTRGSHSQRLATGGRKRGRHSWPPAGRSS